MKHDPPAGQISLETAEDALRLLGRLGASPRLLLHHELVAEAARLIVAGLHARFKVPLDDAQVFIGACLHDAGKIRHPEDLDGPGTAHAEAGLMLLTAAGVDSSLARFCRTHVCWPEEAVALEDLLVALADKLWKGKREDDLELRTCNAIAVATGEPVWKVFEAAETLFAEVARGADERLERSRAAR